MLPMKNIGSRIFGNGIQTLAKHRTLDELYLIAERASQQLGSIEFGTSQPMKKPPRFLRVQNYLRGRSDVSRRWSKTLRSVSDAASLRDNLAQSQTGLRTTTDDDCATLAGDYFPANNPNRPPFFFAVSSAGRSPVVDVGLSWRTRSLILRVSRALGAN